MTAGTGARGSATIISIRGISKTFSSTGDPKAGTEAVSGVDLDISEGEFVCLVGPSGCGKTTLLRMIAGLEAPSAGELLFKGRPISGAGADRGMIFQSFALFPWRTVRRNIEFGLEVKRLPREERRRISREHIELVGLKGFEGAHPRQLSGGMQQRVGLARALANDPAVLLMDEPFGSLDAMTRDLLHDELERLWRERGLTVVFVTHDVREAVRLGDRIVLLTSRPGKVAEEFPVHLDRPRQIGTREVGEIAAVVLERLRQEVRRHATDR